MKFATRFRDGNVVADTADRLPVLFHHTNEFDFHEDSDFDRRRNFG